MEQALVFIFCGPIAAYALYRGFQYWQQTFSSDSYLSSPMLKLSARERALKVYAKTSLGEDEGSFIGIDELDVLRKEARPGSIPSIRGQSSWSAADALYAAAAWAAVPELIVRIRRLEVLCKEQELLLREIKNAEKKSG